MQYIHIPDTDIVISPLGLGTSMAGVKWGKTAQEADEMFGTFLECGGNLIDTAHVYSDWQVVDGVHEIARSERVIGEWLSRSGKRDQIVLLTKGGHPDFSRPGADLHKNRCTKEDMRSDLESSLQKLQTDYVDIYMYHRDDRNIPVEEMAGTMQEFVEEGKIRYWSVANWNADRMRAADAYCKRMGWRGPVADEALMNAGSRHMKPLSDDTLVYVYGDSGLYDYHKENPGNLLIPYMGIAEGFFQKYLAGGAEAVGASSYAVPENLAFAERIPALMEKYECSVMNVILGFFTQQPMTCVPLVGPRNAETIKDACRTFEIGFGPDILPEQ